MWREGSFKFFLEKSLSEIWKNNYKKLHAGRFKNEVAVVCGGLSGIGRATVERFVNDGAKVAIFDINEE